MMMFIVDKRSLSEIVLVSLLFFVWLSLVTSTMSVRAASSEHVPMLEYDDGQIRVLNCVLGASSRESCDVRSYHKIMWLWATPTLCVALITLVFLVIYFPSKYWCYCCGGRYQTPNLCCPDNQLPAKYSKGELFRPVFLSAACCVMCIAGCIWACTSAWRVQNGLNEVMQHSELVVQNMHSALYEILLPNFEEITHLEITSLRKTTIKESQLFLLSGTSNTKEEVEPVLQSLIQLIENMQSLSIVALHNFVSQYTIAIYPICVIALLTSVFGVVAGVCNWRRYTSMAVMTLLCVLSILIWLLTAHSVVSHFVITGACSEVFAFNQQRVNVLEAAMNCNQSHLQMLSTTLDDIAHSYSTYIVNNNNNSNKQLIEYSVIPTRAHKKSLCQSAEIGSRNYENEQHQTSNAKMDEMQESSENDIEQARLQPNIAERLSDNSYSNSRDNYNYIDTANMQSSQTVQHHYHQEHVIVAEEKMIDDGVERLSAVQRLQHVMTTVKSRLTECEAIINEFVSPLDLTCQQVVENAYNLYQGLGLLALATTVGLFAYIYGAKRFIAFDQAYLPQYDVVVN